MHGYRVEFVADDKLPEGTDWAIARCPEHGCCIAFFKQSRLTPAVLEEAWGEYRNLAMRPVPQPRQSRDDWFTPVPAGLP